MWGWWGCEKLKNCKVIFEFSAVSGAKPSHHRLHSGFRIGSIQHKSREFFILSYFHASFNRGEASARSCIWGWAFKNHASLNPEEGFRSSFIWGWAEMQAEGEDGLLLLGEGSRQGVSPRAAVKGVDGGARVVAEAVVREG